MKYLFIALLLLLSLPSDAQLTAHKKIAQRNDTHDGISWIGIDSFRWNYQSNGLLTQLNALRTNSSGLWNDLYRFIYVFDMQQQLLEQRRENWNGSAWINHTRYTYSYDGNGNRTQLDYDTWNGSTWNITGRIVYSGYNPKKRYTNETVYIWSGSSWNFLSRDLYQYYSNDTQVMYRERYDWNAALNQWDGYDRMYYTYLMDSVSSATRSVRHNGAWLPESRELFTFTSAPLFRTDYERQVWDTLPNPDIWRDDLHISYTYTGSNQLKKTTRERNLSGFWQPETRSEYVYNASDQCIEYWDEVYAGGWANNYRELKSYSGNLLSELQQFKGVASGWVDEAKLTFTYDAYDSLIYKQVDTFNGVSFVPKNRFYYYFDEVPVGVNQVDSQLADISLYPNPASTNIHIRCRMKSAEYMHVRIFDVKGNLRMQIDQPFAAGDNLINLDVSPFPSGNYFVRFQAGNKAALASYPFVIQR